MRTYPAKPPTDVDLIHIARLLLARARAGEFGLDDRQRPPGVYRTHVWEIRFPLLSYWLNDFQAAALSLGKVTLHEAGNIRHSGNKLFRIGKPVHFDLHSFPTGCDNFPPERKPAASEARYVTEVSRKAARGGS